MSSTTTVLDSLRWLNPEVEHDVDGGSNTKNTKYHTPMKIVPWAEFNMDTIASIAEGKLLRVIQTTPSLLSVPPELGPAFCFEEDSIKFIMTKWNHEVVQKGLSAVNDQLPTCTWNSGILAKSNRGSSILTTASASYASTPASESTIPPHAASVHAALNYACQGRGTGLRPDAGATFFCHAHGNSCAASWIERLPKDYKTPTKWRSWEALQKLLENKNGNLIAKETKKDHAFPFRQAYTYCVEYNCRYGCILTTEEAFVFRIRPANPTRPPNSSKDANLLKNALRKCGLMEYASIPWSQSGGAIVAKGKQKKKEQPLTFNLAVWFLHVLAASDFQPDWTYNALRSQDLQLHECPHQQVPATPESEQDQGQRLGRNRARGRSGSRKRAYEDVGESYTHSFTSDSLAFTSSFQSQRSRRSESAPSDTTYRNERAPRVPNGGSATSIDQGDSFASSHDDTGSGNTELRRSKRVRAETSES